MTTDVNYQNNPLHGVSLKTLVAELANHYGFKILHAYLNINCFATNPSVESSVKFLKKTDWAREKVEAFYLYQLKSLPRASAEQFELPPRDRIIPAGGWRAPAREARQEGGLARPGSGPPGRRRKASSGHGRGLRRGPGRSLGQVAKIAASAYPGASFSRWPALPAALGAEPPILTRWANIMRPHGYSLTQALGA